MSRSAPPHVGPENGPNELSKACFVDGFGRHSECIFWRALTMRGSERNVRMSRNIFVESDQGGDPNRENVGMSTDR